jgi:hypothetical protein
MICSCPIRRCLTSHFDTHRPELPTTLPETLSLFKANCARNEPRNSPAFMATTGSSPFTQQSDTGLSPAPDQSNRHPPKAHFPNTYLSIISLSTAWFSALPAFQPTLCTHFSSPDARYLSGPSHIAWFNHLNNIRWKARNMALLSV